MVPHLARSPLKAIEVAGSLSGVPFLGAAALLLTEVAASCEQVVVHKKKCRALADKCARLLSALSDASSKLEDAQLNQAIDEVSAVLEKTLRRVKNWAQYNKVKAYIKQADIETGLDLCDRDVNTAFQVFQTSSVLYTFQSQRDSIDSIRSDNAEMRELLYQILTSRQELHHITEMQRAGEHVAEPIMQAGQIELRQLRDRRDRDFLESQVLTTPPSLEPQEDRRYLDYQHGLLDLHRATGILPSVKRLDGEVTKEGELAIAGGTYSDIWIGYWLGEQKVALKALRNIRSSDPRAQKRFEHEINVWASLVNEHILPFLGIVTDLGLHIHMVSPWLENGNVLAHVKNHPEANRIHLLSGAAQGLNYLHAQNVIHGNIKCTNILVTSTGEACICDFGMSKAIEDVTERAASATLTVAGSARWLAPELIEGSIPSPTKSSDTYSFAMAVLELVTLKHPYSDRKRDASVIHDIVVLKRTPSFPDEPEVRRWLTKDLWKLMQDCWNLSPPVRPQMQQVAEQMKDIETNDSCV